MSAIKGTPRARALAAAIRQARRNALEQDPSLTVREVARRLGTSHPTIVQWENGKRVPTIEDLAAFLATIGVTGAERERILDLSREAANSSWLTVGTPGINQALAGALECERTANKMTEWSPMTIPGLLQTSDYARSIGIAEPGVLVRAGRRDILTKPNPVGYTALIGEAAFDLRLGGRETYLNQLKYLLKVATETPNVTVQIVRTQQESWHPGLGGPFALYEFPDSPSIVHLEHHRSSAFLYEEDDVTTYREAALQLREQVAMSPNASLELIARIIQETGETEHESTGRAH